ncbi:MAG TPA: hypothetical protein VFU02_25190 [Polyangiaceae bacterium]|nr:hypothetical protein [Polyangiaceae bacterium]
MKLELTPVKRGILVGLAQLLLVGSLAGKLWYERASLPRVWVRCAGVDPDDPLRGRYVELLLNVPLAANIEPYGPARLRVDGGQLVAEPAPHFRRGAWNEVSFAGRESDPTSLVRLSPPVAVFLPEHVPDPTLRRAGEQLWLEVTVPEEGPPRPIRLGIQRGNAAIVPLGFD